MSDALQSPPADHHADRAWLVACLCAQWCGTCRDFRSGFDALAERHPDVKFRWVDIEDESELVDDVDVENFPTILIQHGGDVLFFGTILPNTAIVERQLGALRATSAPARVDGPDLLSRLPAGEPED